MVTIVGDAHGKSTFNVDGRSVDVCDVDEPISGLGLPTRVSEMTGKEC